MPHLYRLFGVLAALLLPILLAAQAPPAGFFSTTVSTQWNQAVGLTFTHTGAQMFVWERPGKVWVVENGQRQLLLDISEEVGSWEDHGLLGFALHPQFDTNGYFYLFYAVDRHHLFNFGLPSYSPTTNEYFNATIARLTRYTATRTGSGYAVVPGSRTVLLGATPSTGLPLTSGSHSTGTLLFGTDGTLLVSTGDCAMGGELDWGSNPNSYYAQALADGILSSRENVGAFRAQLLSSLSGKILRLDPLTGAGVASNPFYSATTPNATRSKVWALGLRNPFRMTLKPGTGSTNPADGNPGAIYLGDVGFSTWEEVDVVDRPGLNLGWPLYEGLTPHTPFMDHLQANPDAPNPLYNVSGCTQQYFNFQDLIKQATPTGTASFANPCNSGQAIPASVPTFVHTRPLIDWHHGTGPSRTGIFSGNTATTINIGAAGSPVSGPQFGGSTAVGGVFYPYNDFPPAFQNTYFFGDYSTGWLRTLTVDAANKPSAVQNFVNSGSVVVNMAVSPAETGLYYVNFYPCEIRKITYGQNNPPVAVASADKNYGPGPLSVQFTGAASSDPDGQALSYLWNFGDGTTSTQVNPAHTFTPATTAPTKYAVTLTVRDPQGNSNTASLVVSANNTPPQVTITSPAAGTRYPITSQTTYDLRATVTDAEHSGSQLSYAWQTFLHHETHEHPDAIDTVRQTTTTLAPFGCGAETYYYRIELTVTDAAGLSTKQEVRLDPDCSNGPTYTFYRAVNLGGGALTLDGNAWAAQTGAANFSTNGTPFSNNTVPLVPTTDATRTGLIRSSVYRIGSLTTTVSAVPAGTYQVFAYVWEDNNPEVYSLALNGQTVLSNYNSGSAGTWAKLGPYTVTLTATGSVQLVASGGTPNLSGVELWRQSSGGPTNQPPVANAGPDQTLPAGTTSAQLNGTASADPDAGQTLTYAWSQQPGGPSQATFSNPAAASPTVSGLVPGTYTFALTVTDNLGAASAPDLVTVTVSAAPGSFVFYRAVNLGGPALTLDGNAWGGSTAANYSTTGSPFVNTTVPLVPATDAARTGMIRAAVYRTGSLGVTLSAVPAGTYQAYVYVWEDNNPEVYSLAVNGQTVLSNYNSGAAGTWARLGPYPVTLTATGAVQITAAGGTANFSGVELWQQTGGTGPTNQPPVLAAIGSQTVTAGQQLRFTASATDADVPPQTLTYSLAGTVPAGAGIDAASGVFTWTPTTAQVGTSTFAVRVTDNGSPALTDEKLVTVTVNAAGGNTFVFYRAVNLGGGALTLDGNAWAAQTGAANFSTNGSAFSNTTVPLVPATDAARTGMIRAAVYRIGSLTATFSAVPAGTYQAYVYVWEDNNPEVYSLAVNGQTVLSSYNSGAAGTWARLGPYPVTLTATGAVQITAAGGTANFSGVELWRQSSTAARESVLASAAPAAEFGAYLYPNPSPNGRFYLALPPAFGAGTRYVLVSPLGTTLAAGTLSAAQVAGGGLLDLSGRLGAAGVYYLQLSSAGRVAHLKLLRE